MDQARALTSLIDHDLKKRGLNNVEWKKLGLARWTELMYDAVLDHFTDDDNQVREVSFGTVSELLESS